MKHLLRIAHTHAWKRWRVLPLLLSIALTFVIVATVSAAAIITATKTYTIIGDDGDGKADPGETIEYTVAITNSGVVPGADDATGVNFTDTIDANTTLVGGSLHASPIAFNDAYTWVGNTLLDTSARGLGSVTANDVALTDSFTLTPITNGATSQGGTVTLGTNGHFVYTPQAGDTAVADTFTYTLTSTADGTLVGTGTVTINLSGRVWYLQAGGTGDGRSNTPSGDPAAMSTSANLSTDIFYVFSDAGPLNGPFTLDSGQLLLGQGVNLVVSSITLFTAGTPPTITNSGGDVVTLNSTGGSNTVSGLVVGNASGAGIFGSNFGTLTVSNTSINTNGQALNLSTGTIAGSGFTSVTSTGGTNNISLTTIAGTLPLGTGALSGASGTAFNVSGGTLSAIYSGNITKNNAGTMVNVSGGHATGTITFQTGILSATTASTGNGLQFDNADGIYNFNGTTTLNGGDAGVDILNGSGGTFSFSNNTAITSPTGTAFNMDGSTADVTYSGNITQATAGQAAVAITNEASGTVTFQTGTLSATNGTGLQFDNADGTYNFNGTTTLNGGDAGVDIFTGSGGTFNFAVASGTTSITNPTGIAYREDTSTANVTYNGTITKTNNANNAVDINAKTGGTTSFTGAITASSATANAIDLTNTGGIVNFSGGLNLTTTSGTGFNATGSGATVSATQNNTSIVNTISATTGTALNVANTTISSNNLEFRSISANGGTNGIVLNTTGSGGLIVTGNSTGLCGGQVGSGPPTSAATATPPVTADCTGGTIQNTTGPGIVLTNASNISLTRIWLRNSGDDGVQGTNVTGFTLASSFFDNNGNAVNENGLDFGDTSSITPDGLHGTGSIANSTVQNSYYNGVSIRNLNGVALTSFNITGSQFRANAANGDANDNVFMEAGGTANMVISVTGSFFASIEGDHFQAAALNSGTLNVNFTNNTLTGGHSTALGQGITINAATGVAFGGYSGRVDYDVNGNNITGAVSNGVSVVLGTSSAAAVFDGFVRNNVIGTSGSALSCSTQANGVYIDARGNGTHNSAVTGNTIRQCFDRGILSEAGDGDSVLNLIVQSNTIDQQVDAGAREAIQTNHGITSTNVFGNIDTNNVCLQLGGAGALANVLSHGGGAPDDFRLRKRFEATVRLPGYAGGTGQDATSLAQVVAFIQGQNTGSAGEPGSAAASGTGGGYTGGASCTAPIAMAPNTSQALAQYPAEDNRLAASFASNSDTNSATVFAPAYDLGSMFQPAAWVTPNAQSVSPAAALIASDAADRKSGLFAPPTAPALSGETVSIPPFTLPAGKSVTIKFRVTVDPLDPGEIRTRILNQSNVTYTGGPVGGIDTTDPTPNLDPACTAAPAIGTQTCTPVDRPDTTVSSINRQTPLGANTNASAVTWRVTFADAISGLTSSNFTLLSGGSLSGTSITSVTAVGSAPATQWDVLVNTGSGDGLLELNMTSAAGLSHDVLGLPFTTGQDYTIDRSAPTVASILRQSPASNPTNADVLVFRITFNEAVQGVGANSFVATGTTTTIDSSVTSITPNLVFDFSVDGTLNGDLANLNGTVGLDVSATPTITDLAGNTLVVAEPSPASNDQTYTLDNLAPAAPVVVAPANGSSTNDTTPTVTGTAEANSTITVYIDSVSAGTTTADGSGNWSFITGILTEASHTVKATATDAVGNISVDSNTNTFTVDTTPPPAPVVVTPANGSSTNDTTPTVTGTAEANSTITVFFDGSSAGTTTADGSGNWSFTPGLALSAAVHTVRSQATDAAGNPSVDSNTNTFTIDTTVPAVTINQAAGQADPTNSSPINFTVVFNEPVTGFATGDVTLAGTAGATTGTVTEIAPNNGTTYTVAVSGMTADGTVIASILAGVAQDAASNGNSASTSTDNTVTYDTAAPTVTINQAAGQADPTNSSPINFTVVFNEPVTGFVTGDVTIGGTAGATTAIVTEIAPNNGTTYTVAVSNMTTDGTVIASILAGVAQDVVANGNTASTSIDNTATYDTAAPTVTINQAAGQADPTNSGPINLLAIFSEPMTGFATGDVTIGGTAGATTGTVTEIAPNDGTTYTVAISGMATDGTVIASILAGVAQDAAGNGNSASTSTDNTVTYDATAPTVTINQAAGQADPTNSGPINFLAIFSEPVTGFGAVDVAVGGTAGATSATVTEIAPNDGTTYTVAISGMTADGTVIAGIPPGVAQDTAGNGNSASTSTDNTVTFDATVPTVTISSVAPDPTNTSPIPVTAQFSEIVGGFVVGDIIPGNGTVGNFVAVDGDTYTFDLTPSGQGLVTADIAAGVAQDTAGNNNTAATQFSRTYDTVGPTVTMSSTALDPTNTSPIPVTVQFSETVGGFDALLDVTATNGTIGNFVAVDGDTYTFDLTPSGQGLVTADIAAAVATDAAGNSNTVASQFSRTYDTIAPTVTIDQAAGQADPTGTAPINFVVVFSESVTGFGGLDVNLSGAAGATTATVTEIAPNDGTTYSVAVSGMTGSGTVIASIPASAAQDAATNGNTASTSTDNTVTFDPVFPVVTGIVRADPSPTNAASVHFTVTFAKDVSGVGESDFTFTTSGVTGAAITGITGSGTTWTVTVSTGTGDGTLRLDLVDDDTIVDGANNPLGGKGVGNGDFTSGEVYTIDKTGPNVVAVVRANASPTNAAIVDFSITFSEIVTGVDAGDFGLATSGVSGAAITNVAGNGTTWTATVNTGSGSGAIGLNLVDDDTIVDVVGNPLGGTGTGNGNFTGAVYTIDKIAPQAGNLVATNVITGGGSTQTFTVVFSDNLAINIASLDGSDIRVTGPGGFNQPATLVSVTPATNGTPRTATYQISAPGGSWDNADNGAYTVALQANQVGDTAGNTVAVGALGTFNVDVSVARRLVYLPLIIHSAAQAPDLVVSSVTLNPNKTTFTTSEPVQISVVIKNQGNAPTTPFWVDLYLNPARTPALNLIWSQVCSLQPCYGIAWQVTQPLAPGAELTLTSTVGSFATGYTNWRERLAAGTTDLYVQADSWNPGRTVGASGDTNLANNLFHISGLRVTGQSVAGAGADVAIPARPR